jgi:hypothetical protein
MFAIAYNLVRLVMLEAARRQVPLDRISFIDACVGCAVPTQIPPSAIWL